MRIEKEARGPDGEANREFVPPGRLISEEDFASHPKLVDDAYKQQAYNCWVCAGIYILLLALSAQQMWLNIKPKPYAAA